MVQFGIQNETNETYVMIMYISEAILNPYQRTQAVFPAHLCKVYGVAPGFALLVARVVCKWILGILSTESGSKIPTYKAKYPCLGATTP